MAWVRDGNGQCMGFRTGPTNLALRAEARLAPDETQGLPSMPSSTGLVSGTGGGMSPRQVGGRIRAAPGA